MMKLKLFVIRISVTIHSGKNPMKGYYIILASIWEFYKLT
jgi:hypothetical protein